MGLAQERASFRPLAKAQRQPGKYAVTRGSAFVTHIYFYIRDSDFGPSFIKVCSYAPWSIRVWLNGHQWLRRQLERRGIAYQPLENGVASAADPCLLQGLCDRFSAAHIQCYVDRWLYRLPSPLTRGDQRGLCLPAFHHAT